MPENVFGFSSQIAPTRMPGSIFTPPPFSVFDDFSTYVAGSNEDGWILTETGTGTEVIATDEPNGVLHITTGGTDDNSHEFQWANAVFEVSENSRLIFEARLKLTAAANPLTSIEFAVGLATKDTAILDGTTDAICMGTGDGSSAILNGGGASIYAISGAATGASWGTNTTWTDTTIDYADDTYIKLGFELIRRSRLNFFVDGVKRATHTTNIPAEGIMLAPFFAIQTAAGAAKQMQIDYIGAVQARL